MKLTDERKRRLAGLTEHPGFAELDLMVREWADSEAAKVAEQLLKRTLVLNREDVAFLAGQFHGMKDVIDQVKAARKAVETEAKKERDAGGDRAVVRG